MSDSQMTSTATPRAATPHGKESAAWDSPGTAGVGEATAAAREPHNEACAEVFSDPASQALARLLARIAPSDLPVLISGEAGTGKATLARYIHQISGRPGPFVGVKCGTVEDPPAQGEDALSTQARRSATARALTERWFEDAHAGSLFLEEVADLPAGVQADLLCTLQEHEARDRSDATERTSVRLIAATQVDLAEAVSAGRFRLELLCRLGAGHVRLLPLRQRRGDIAALATHFLRAYGKRLKLPPPPLSPQAQTVLTQHPWPGNVRELENVIRCALLVAPAHQQLRVEHLGLGSVPEPGAEGMATALPTSDESALRILLRRLLETLFQAPGERLLNQLENQIVVEAFRFTGRNQVRTAALLGISRNVLRTLLRRHGLLVIKRRVTRPKDRSGARARKTTAQFP